jgi:phytoene dehydrogenase-like protein
VFTDALIGTFTHAHDPSLRQNRCFLYHVIGDGTGEWRVPVGGMGALSAELERAARAAGAEIATGCDVSAIATDGATARVTVREADDTERTLEATHVLSGVAPSTLARLLGEASPPGEPAPEGSSAKVNMLVTRLPALRSGVDPAEAFAGTFHVDEGYAASQAAYESAAAGRMPERPPAEMYCHSLTDPSVLGADLRTSGAQTLTLFGVHLPARLFAADNERARAALAERLLDGLDRHLAEPIRDCLARDAQGNPCVEVHTPTDLEAELGLPGGHIFHGDLSWPWAENGEAGLRWGAETAHANVWLCGAGARRGGGVSGVAGHNAAMAVLESTVTQQA